jgi:bifunctional N-acetylglucosamine-1-phosphate-uridyltransferase/glucosamine-1-phosphate-acetyltransferase GlmU-like protein
MIVMILFIIIKSITSNLIVTILAGGLGKRMKSTLPKVLHELNGKPMLVRVIQETLKLNPYNILVVVGQYKPIIKQTLEKWNVLDKVDFAIQENPLGTGHAILCTLDQLPNDKNSL